MNGIDPIIGILSLGIYLSVCLKMIPWRTEDFVLIKIKVICAYTKHFDRMVRCWGIQFFFDILLFFSYIFFFSFIFLSVHFSNILSFIWIYFWMEKSNKTLWTQQTQKKKDTEILQDKVNLCLINRFLYLQCGFKYKRIR